MIRRLRITWRRARRTGRDLNLAAYAAAIAGGTLYLVALTGALGPTLDARQPPQATPYQSAQASVAGHAPY
jgi:hypothetical protein